MDFGAKTLILGGKVKVPFKRPIGNHKAIPETNVIVPVGTPIQVRALVDSKADGLPLLVEAQPVTGNDRIIVVSAIVKEHKQRVTIWNWPMQPGNLLNSLEEQNLLPYNLLLN